MTNDLEQARQALEFIPSHDRDAWLKAAMAMKAGFGEEGFPVWDQWSQTAENYSDRAARATWKSIDASGPVGMGTLFHLAKQCGWRPEQRPADLPAPRRLNTPASNDGGVVERALKVWEAAQPEVGEHRYLREKGIQPHDIRTNGLHLLVPIRDSEGQLHSLQKIAPDGGKRFLPGGNVRGNYFAIGRPVNAICIAEGFATGASIHEATGMAVAVAFNCGNLERVAKALRAKYPDIRLIVCADDDIKTEGNPGTRCAAKAARAVNGLIAVPDFGVSRPDDVSDFNDLARISGNDKVAACILAARAPEKAASSRGVVLRRASDIEPEPMTWIWDGYLAAGKFHVLAGAPGTGKTNIALAMAAIISSGARWPDGTKAEPGNVLMWSSEDDAETTLVPRLMAMGADLKRIHFIDGVPEEKDERPFDPAKDMARVAMSADEMGDVRLLIVDPVVSAVAADSNKNAEVRRALQPMVDFGMKNGAAVLGISHFTKGTGGRDPLERVTGSIAFGALARVVLGTIKEIDPESGEEAGRVLVRIKCNVGNDKGGIRYSLRSEEVRPGIHASSVVWGEILEDDARTLFRNAEAELGPDGAEQRDAASWLREVLSDGPMKVPDIKKLAAAEGINWRAVENARPRIKAESKRNGFGGGARWSLPIPTNNPPFPPFPPDSESGANGLNGANYGGWDIAEGAI